MTKTKLKLLCAELSHTKVISTCTNEVTEGNVIPMSSLLIQARRFEDVLHGQRDQVMLRHEQVEDKWVNGAGNYLLKDSIHTRRREEKDNIRPIQTKHSCPFLFVYSPADAKATPVWTQIHIFSLELFFSWLAFENFALVINIWWILTQPWIAPPFDPKFDHAGLNALKYLWYLSCFYTVLIVAVAIKLNCGKFADYNMNCFPKMLTKNQEWLLTHKFCIVLHFWSASSIFRW